MRLEFPSIAAVHAEHRLLAVRCDAGCEKYSRQAPTIRERRAARRVVEFDGSAANMIAPRLSHAHNSPAEDEISKLAMLATDIRRGLGTDVNYNLGTTSFLSI